MLSSLARLFTAGFCSPTEHRRAAMAQNKALCEVLDDGPEAMQQGTNANGSEDLQEAASKAEIARQKAEAHALDLSSRLRVALEQTAEFANASSTEAKELSQAVEDVLKQAETAGSSGSLGSLLEALHELHRRISDSAEAQAHAAAMLKTDAETLKRSSQQAELPAANQDADMKRQREDAQQVADGEQEAAAANGEQDADVPMASPTTSNMDDTAPSTSSWAERAKYIPMRLEQEERRLLRLLQAALEVNEYVDKVDILRSNKSQRIQVQIKDICAILSGLVVAQDYKRGQQLVKDRDFVDNVDFFQACFEVGRRYKIMNPDKMRSEYGKLMYMLMDSTAVADMLGFECVKPLKSVATFLESRGGQGLLRDPLLDTATAEIYSGDRPRHEVQRDIKVKERAREALARRYRNGQLSEEEILTSIYSLSDSNSYLLFNRDPIDRMLDYFTSTFSVDSHQPGYSLAIQGGREGARLTHNHERQYHYVLQSLTLWREISTDMFKLWYLAEQDMLREGASYRLCDTGQGLNRVQAAPSVSKAMYAIISRCQQRIGNWVGSSVVHLGDHNVPNALHFIDKYTQVPRILNPVVSVLDELPKLYRDPHLRQYIDATFGGMEQCRKAILVDFCRHAFDGSGADNFFDAGSCIDGRLTSAWNWCARIEKKAYFPVFRLAGFTSFDGEWK